jgi:hypothetical protein
MIVQCLWVLFLENPHETYEDLYVVDDPTKFQLNWATNNHSPELLVKDRRKTLESRASIQRDQKLSFDKRSTTQMVLLTQKLPFISSLPCGRPLNSYCSFRNMRLTRG